MVRRYSAKVDNNQRAMVSELRAMGFAVFPTHRVGQGFPDLCISRGGITMLCEVKQGRGKLDTLHRNAQPIKSIWIYPLVPDFRRHLCNG